MRKQSIDAGQHSNGAPRRFTRKKKVAAMTVATMTIAGAAFAYWTAGGSGTGTAGTGTGQAVTVHQTSVVAGLAPGATPQALSGNFDNPNTAAVEVASVTGSVTGTNETGCNVAWYEITGTATVTAPVPAGIGVGSWSGLSVQLVNNVSVNQNACKGATVTITYTAS